jgi:hypothetical protein
MFVATISRAEQRGVGVSTVIAQQETHCPSPDRGETSYASGHQRTRAEGKPMSVFVPLSTLIRLVLWLAATGVVVGVMLGAQSPAAISPGPAPTTAVHPATGQPAVEAAAGR